MDSSLKYLQTGLNERLDHRLSSLFLAPDSAQFDRLRLTLIRNSRPLPKIVSETFNPLYIIDISAKHPVFKSLTIDYMGDSWVSCQTSDWVAEAVFSHLGFKYRYWSEFLRMTNHSPRTIYPYVNGNIVYLRFCQSKQSNWLNVSNCHHIDLPDISSNYQVTSQQFFHFTFNFSNDASRKCIISLKLPTRKLIKQLEFANHLCLQWYYYYSASLPMLHLNMHLHLDGSRAHKIFPHSQFYQANLSLIDSRLIKDFLQFNAVCEHFNTGPNPQHSKELTQLYIEKGLEPTRLRKALAHYDQ